MTPHTPHQDRPRAPGVEIKPLARLEGGPEANLGWTLDPDVRDAIRKDAGEWAQEALPETIEAIALATEARILSHAPAEASEPMACVACEDKPKAPNDPCAICGKVAFKPAEGQKRAEKRLATARQKLDARGLRKFSEASEPTPASGEVEPGEADGNTIPDDDWLVWWQGSGPLRGDHVMRTGPHYSGYAGEVAYLGDQHHKAVGELVAEHNKRVHKLNRALKAARNGEREANERAEIAEAAHPSADLDRMRDENERLRRDLNRFERSLQNANLLSEDGHWLVKTGDKDASGPICDRNGEVVLGWCRRCCRAEAELDEGPCPGTPDRTGGGDHA